MLEVRERRSSCENLEANPGIVKSLSQMGRKKDFKKEGVEILAMSS